MNSNIWFFGTGRFAARCLEEIAPAFPLSLVVTAPPSISGRGLKSAVSPVENVAVQLGLPLRRSASVNRDEELLAIYGGNVPDLIFVIDFGQKIGEPWLSGPRCGCVNIHPSLLPLYRGAAPVQRAVIDGCPRTGVTLFRLVAAMDAGPVWLQADTPIGENETAGELFERLAVIGSGLFVKNASELLDGTAVFTRQDDSRATFAPKIDKAETRLDPRLPARKLHNLVRGLQPSPGGYFIFRGKRVKVISSVCRAEKRGEAGSLCVSGVFPRLCCAEGSLELRVVQPEGKKAMNADAWLKGIRLVEGERVD